MATIKFEDGTSVNFDGDPTQADIEEVAKNLKLTKKTPAKPSLAQGLSEVVNAPGPLKTASTLFSSTGKLAGGAALNVSNLLASKTKDVQQMNESNTALDTIDQQAIQKARTLAASGDKEKAKRLLTVVQSHGGNVTLNDILPDSQQNTFKQIAGAGAGTFLEQAAFAKGSGLPIGVTARAAQVAAPVARVASKIPGVATLAEDTAAFVAKYPKTSTILRGGLEATPYGAGFGASEALQKEGATLGDVAGGTVKGAALGFGFGAGTAAALMPAAGLYTMFRPPKAKVQQAVNDLEDTYIGIATGRQGLKNKLDKANLKTEFKNAAGTEGQNPTRVLAEHGIIPNQKGAVLDTFDQAEKFTQDTLSKYKTINRAGITAVGEKVGKVPLSDLEEAAVAKVRTQHNIDAGLAGDLEKGVRKDFEQLRGEYGDMIDLTKVDDIKSARWSKTKFDSNKPLQEDVNYAIGSAAQKMIEQKANEAGLASVAQLNREIGDRLEAAKFLKSLNGVKVEGGRLQKHVFRIIGSSLGTNAPGRLLGALGGDAIANILVDNAIATPVRRKILKQLQVEDPAAYKATIEWLAKNKVAPELLPALPAPAPKVKGEGNRKPTVNHGPLPMAEPGVFAGREKIKEKPFTPGKSGVVKNAPAPQLGTPVMRVNQRALPASGSGMPITVFPVEQNGSTVVGRNLRSGPVVLPQKNPQVIEGKIVKSKGLKMLKKNKKS